MTTRNPNLAFEPAGAGIEVPHFDTQSGSGFLIHLLQLDIAQDLGENECRSAMELAEKLDGHALAINTMAGLIHRRQWSISQFLRAYEKSPQKCHGSALDAVWRLSFESLDSDSSMFLGIISYLMPDAIPQDLFELEDASFIHKNLAFCQDEFSCVIHTRIFCYK